MLDLYYNFIDKYIDRSDFELLEMDTDEDNDIRSDTRLGTSVSKEDHVSKGNKLGIIDRLVTTLRE
jgi:hypothetical protein